MQLDANAALQFLAAIGRDPAAACLRGFLPQGAPKEVKEADRGSKHSWGDWAGIEHSESLGRGLYVVINEGGNTKAEITSIIGYFAEFDKISREEQYAVIANKMPPPSIVVDSGGKSLHFYWLFDQPIACAPVKDCPIKLSWQEEQKRLAKYLGSDPSINDPNRVMRLPGAIYFDGQKQAIGRAAIVSLSGARYSREQLVGRLPAPEKAVQPVLPTPPPRPVSASSTSRRLREVIRQLNKTPQRIPGSQTRYIYLKQLWALADFVGPAEAGRMFAQHSPAWAAAEDLVKLAGETDGSVKIESFFHITKDEWRVMREAHAAAPTMQNAAPIDMLSPLPPQAPPQAPPPLEPPAPGGQDGPGLPTGEQPAVAQLSATLKAEMREGLSGARLAERSAELAAEFGVYASEVNAVIKELQEEIDGEAQAQADAVAITAERKAAELRKLFTLDYLLPARLAAPLKIIQHSLRSDDLSTAMIYLTSASGVLRLGTRFAADLFSFHEPPILWLAIIGVSGKGKTPAIKNIGSLPLSLVRKEYDIVNERRLGEHTLKCMGMAPNARKPPPPLPVIPVIERFTGAALQLWLQEHQKENLGMLIKVDELAGLFQGLNQFNQSGKGDEQQQMLSLFDGQGDATLRVKEGARIATEWQVSIIGGIQPDVFDTYIRNGDPDGLFARLLLLPLPNKPIPAFYEPTPEETQAYHEATEQLARFTAELHRLPPITHPFSLAARQEIHRLRQQTDDIIDAELIKANQNVYGKRVGYIVRVAGVLHLCDIVAGSAALGSEVSLATINKAREVIDFLQAYACEAHIRAQQSDDVTVDDMLRRIHAACLNKPTGAGRFRADRLTRKQRRTYSTAAITAYMDQLVSLDCGAWIDAGSRGRNFVSHGRLT